MTDGLILFAHLRRLTLVRIGAVAAAWCVGWPVAACNLRDLRVCDYDAQLQRITSGHVVSYQETFNGHTYAGSEYEWVINAADIIHLTNSDTLKNDALFFIMAHEFGHSVANDGRRLMQSLAANEEAALSDLQLFAKYGKVAAPQTNAAMILNHDIEYAADAFAIRTMLALKRDPLKAMRSLPMHLYSDLNHPSKQERLARAQLVVAQAARLVNKAEHAIDEG